MVDSGLNILTLIFQPKEYSEQQMQKKIFFNQSGQYTFLV